MKTEPTPTEKKKRRWDDLDDDDDADEAIDEPEIDDDGTASF